MLTIFEQHGLPNPIHSDLEFTVSHLLARKFAERSPWQWPFTLLKKGYVLACAGIGAIVYSEKLAGLIPRMETAARIPWDIVRLGIGALGATPHITTYYVAASNFPDFLHRTWETSPKKTIGFMSLGIPASLSFANVYLSVPNNKTRPPTLPLPNQTQLLGLVFAIIANLAAMNINYESCGNKFILPSPSPVGKILRETKKSIVDEKPVKNPDVYFAAIRSIQSTLFKPKPILPDEPSSLYVPLLEQERPQTCWSRFRSRFGI
jgi:hypothetical protein